MKDYTLFKARSLIIDVPSRDVNSKDETIRFRNLGYSMISIMRPCAQGHCHFNSKGLKIH
jgi:hypothetical protein